MIYSRLCISYYVFFIMHFISYSYVLNNVMLYYSIFCYIMFLFYLYIFIFISLFVLYNIIVYVN